MHVCVCLCLLVERGLQNAPWFCCALTRVCSEIRIPWYASEPALARQLQTSQIDVFLAHDGPARAFTNDRCANAGPKHPNTRGLSPITSLSPTSQSSTSVVATIARNCSTAKQLARKTRASPPNAWQAARRPARRQLPRTPLPTPSINMRPSHHSQTRMYNGVRGAKLRQSVGACAWLLRAGSEATWVEKKRVV